MRAAETKVAKIHARLPMGGVLVFLTGQREIVELCERLGKRFGGKGRRDEKHEKKGERKGNEGMRAAEGGCLFTWFCGWVLRLLGRRCGV